MRCQRQILDVCWSGGLISPMQKCFSDLVCQTLVTSNVIDAYLSYLCLAMLHVWTLEYQHMMLCVRWWIPTKAERRFLLGFIFGFVIATCCRSTADMRSRLFLWLERRGHHVQMIVGIGGWDWHTDTRWTNTWVMQTDADAYSCNRIHKNIHLELDSLTDWWPYAGCPRL